MLRGARARHCWLLSVAIIWLRTVPCSSAVPPCDSKCQSLQRSALYQLYEATGGPVWANNSGWASNSSNFCTWFGIICCSPNNSSDASEDELKAATRLKLSCIPTRTFAKSVV